MEGGAVFIDVQSIGPLAKTFVDYGPFFLFVFLFGAGLFLLRSQQRFLGIAIVSVSLAFAVLGTYFWVYPPQRFFVHRMLVQMNLDDDFLRKMQSLTLYRSDDDERIWVDSGTPKMRGMGGETTLEWNVLALDQMDLSQKPNINLRATFMDTSGDPPFRVRDHISTHLPSGAQSTCVMKPAGNSETEGSGAYFKLDCRSTSAARLSAVGSSSFSLMSMAIAQTPNSEPRSGARATRRLLIGDDVDAPQPSLVVFYVKDPSTNDPTLSAISDQLRHLDMTLVKKKSLLPAPTNAVWIGREVDVTAAKSLAKRLIDLGIKLQYFGPYDDPLAKTNLIEVGSSAKNASRRVLTKEDIDAYPVGNGGSSTR